MVEKILVSKKDCVKKILVKKILWVKKICWVKNILGSKILFGEKNFETLILFGFHPEYSAFNILNFFDKDVSSL